MKKIVLVAVATTFAIVLGSMALHCGGDTAGEDEFCNTDSDCQSPLVCRNNTCVEKPSDECDPPCDPGVEVCYQGQCLAVGDPNDKDDDGYPTEVDCDDFNHEVHPEAQEYCDGFDNNCDGTTDEDCPPCVEGETQECGTELGQCIKGIQTCVDGNWDICSGTGPSPEDCDGKDNDCDGATDESCPCQDGDQYPCSVDEGICVEGTQLCEGGAWTGCRSGELPQAEICDGLDNDCDGMTDDGFMVGQYCDGFGECGEGEIECVTETTTLCSTEPDGSQDQSQPEICDGLDNDCDGLTDEDFEVGEPCAGTGVCGDGTWECSADNERVCSTYPGGSADQSQPQLCDGLDNDCDGETDEDFQVGSSCVGEGSCGEGQIECVTESTTQCSTDPGGSADQSQSELCDGQDNDCDGSTDEDFMIAGVLCGNCGECDPVAGGCVGNDAYCLGNCGYCRQLSDTEFNCDAQADSCGNCGACTGSGTQFNCAMDQAKCAGNCSHCDGSGTSFSCAADDSICTGNCDACNGSGTSFSCAADDSICTGNCDVCIGSGTSFSCAADDSICIGNCDVCNGSGTSFSCAADDSICTGNCDVCIGSGTSFSCAADDSICIGNCDACNGSGTSFSCVADDSICSGNCDVCNGSGTSFNCAADDSICSGNCDVCNGSGISFNCVADNNRCTGNCDYCTGSGTMFNCTADNSICIGNCDVCSGSGTTYNCQANASLCTGNCDVCSGSGTVFNCTADNNMCNGNCDICSGSGTIYNCQANASLCTGNCDVCSGSGTTYNCQANASLCTGNCDVCSGSGTVFNCTANNSMCIGNCDICSGSGTTYNCQANANLCTGNCDVCSGSGTVFSCTANNSMCIGNCDTCSGSGTTYNCQAIAGLCTGNCDVCSGSDTAFNCAGNNGLCAGNCDYCLMDSPMQYNCSADNNICTGNCSICAGSGISFNCSGTGACNICESCIGGGTNFACTNMTTTWGESLFGCVGTNNRCNNGSCITCDGYVYADGCGGCAGQGGMACWYYGPSSASCTTVCATHGGCVAAEWNDDANCNLLKHFTTCEECIDAGGDIYSPLHMYAEPPWSPNVHRCGYRTGGTQSCGATIATPPGIFFNRACVCSN